ncbi:NAD(P)/FAD-dependent oxidoreductase [Desulfobacula phenolica]|uniref:Pyridine nucleotide-disulphide oxidoreductase n=1 Tax=Desulfobacula phenolica TaxID=90732 RepID=A0A1H2IGJ7_9BACT|nr:FAD-dependent oxidoreductase [Desulfobacula phenolica]SDU43066.1 Pyridine nucleotide-disulphide oxidoreductase [Desulfobacula phenolica]
MKIAIIGMGPAGTGVVRTLRRHDSDAEITMFSAENVPPYSPPALGDYLITGNKEGLFRHEDDFFKTYNVKQRPGEKIVQVMPEEKQLKTQNNEIFDFDHLVIASGSSLYAPVKGADKKGIYNFKTLDGADQIKRISQEDKTAVVLGGGFIGVEIALCLAKIGIKPTLLNRRGWIMPRLLDVETAGYVEKDLRAQGVEVLLNTEGKEFVGNESVDGLLTSNGKTLTADIYIAATGVKPNIDFIKDTDIEYDQGIVVDEKLRTRYPYIYACGDVAQTIDLLSGKRKIHGLYPVAMDHAQTAACNILGMEREYERPVNINSLKELGFKIIVVGNQKAEEVFEYKTENILRKIYITADKIVGFVLLGDISNAGIYLSLLKKKTNVAKFKHRLLSKGFSPGFLPGMGGVN